MIPVLFDPDVKVFDNNGVGKLSDAEDCTVVETLNSKYELEMKYPIDGIHYENIEHRSIILARPAPKKDPQPFRVYRITKPLNGRVMIYAKHIVYDTEGITTDPFSVTGPKLAFQAMKNNASEDCPFTFETNISSTKIIAAKVPTAIWTLLGSGKGCALDVFGGEYLFDRYNISLLQRRGEDRGLTIRYGKNLTSLEQDENIANCYTAVHPYWANSDGDFIQLSERIVKCSGNYGYTRALPLDLSKTFEDKPTEAQIREYAEQYIEDNDIGKPKVSLKVSYVQREQTEEYSGVDSLDRVYIGDSVTVEFLKLGVSTNARVREVRYKPILERYDSISIGDVKANMASTIVGKTDKSYADNAAKNAVDAQSSRQIFLKLTNGGGEQGIFQGDDGKIYTNMTYAVTGILDAGIITVINLSAESVNTGRLNAVDGKSYFDLDTGKFVSVDENQNAAIIHGGEMWLENSAGKKQVYISRGNEQCCIWLFDSEGNYIGGIGSLENRFLIFAPDEDLDGQQVGHPAIWKTINGVKVLATIS